MKEEFRWIDGYEGLYKVSNLGRILMVERVDSIGRTLPEIIKSTRKGVGGYTVVTLNKDGHKITKLVHRLVAKAFIPNPENKPQVDHVDGSRNNNVVTNLRWVTNAENCANPITFERTIKGTLANPVSGIKSPYSRKVSQYTLDGMFLRTFDSIGLAAKYIGVCATCIGNCASGKQNSAGGYKWEYETEAKLQVNKGIKLPVGFRGKPVIQLTLNGDFVAEYVSIQDAARRIGVNATTIARAINGKYKHCGGFLWRYKD